MTQWLRPDQLELIGLLRAGDRVVVAQGPSQPLTLSELLVRQHREVGSLQIFVGGLFSDTFPPEAVGAMSFTGYGVIGQGCMALSRAGQLKVVPALYSALPSLFADGSLAADVVLLQSAPTEAGGFTLGLNNDYVVEAARRARVVIAEVNDQVPWVHGAECPADVRVDIAIRTSRPPAGLMSSEVGPVEEAIAAHVAGLIPDGSTIQTGIGSIPDAILAALSSHKDLGVHSGLISDRIVALMEAGVINNARKPIDTGVALTNVVLGTDRTKRFVHRNPAVRMAHPSYCHAVQVLAQLDRYIAINSAVEVDLTGQVNAEVADGVYVGAAGGQPDFVRGALLARRGRSLMVLPSTARRGTRSRIVPQLSQGTVTTPRCDADLFVTEWGVADLRGQDFGSRARRIIAIADPKFREDLERAAHEQGLLR